MQNNQNSFTNVDQFGYQDLLNSYLDQRQIYLIENQMLTNKSVVNRNKQKEASQILDETINRTELNLKAYQAVYNSINKNQSYDKDAKYYYIYQGDQANLKGTSNQA